MLDDEYRAKRKELKEACITVRDAQDRKKAASGKADKYAMRSMTLTEDREADRIVNEAMERVRKKYGVKPKKYVFKCLSEQKTQVELAEDYGSSLRKFKYKYKEWVSEAMNL